MSTKPLVSIITPCYNSARFITECVESVLTQDYPYVEHIIQDGDSNDGTKEILERYSAKYPEKIKVVSEPDKGQSDGLHKALQRSKGDAILVLNADDALMPYACSWAVENMEKYPEVGVIYGDVYLMDKQSDILEIYPAPRPYDFKKLLCVESVIPAQAAFIRRSHFEKVGFYADSTLDTCPDYEMLVRIGLKFPMKHVFGVVTKYRKYFRVLDSKKARKADRFFKAKKLIMDRVFDSQDTSSSIRKLRREAYAGLDIWAAGCAAGMGEYTSAYKFFFRGISRYILLGKFKKITWILFSLIDRLAKEKYFLREKYQK